MHKNFSNTKISLVLRLKSVSQKALLLYKIFLISLLKKKTVAFKGFDIRQKKKLLTLLKSPHVNKKSKEQYFFKEFKSVLILNTSLPPAFLSFLLLNKPNCVKISFNVLIK